MFAKLDFLFHFTVLVLVLNVVYVTCEEDDQDFTIETTFVSLTGSHEPFAYIEATCDDNDETNETSTCRTYRCSAFSDLETDIHWYFKPCEDDDCRYVYKEREYERDGLQVLSNITLQDWEYGYLRCFANNSKHNTDVLQEVVTTEQAGRRFIEMAEKGFHYEIFPDIEEVNVQWDIEWHGYPPPNFTLFANDEMVVYGSKYYYSMNGSELFLKIINVSEEDVDTEFSLLAENVYQNKSLNLSFIVTELNKENIQIHSLDETHAELKCVAISLLPPEIIWYFMPCLNEKCRNETVVDGRIEKDGLLYTSYIKVHSSWSGFLRCHIDNFRGVPRDQIQEIYGVKNGLDVFGADSIKTGDAKSKWVQVDDTKNITLTCGSSVNNHTDVIEWAWPDLDKNIDSIYSRTVTKTRNTIFSNVRTLILTGVGIYNFGGTFYCKSWSKDNNTLEYIKIEISDGGFKEWIYYAIGFLLLLIVVITAFIVLKMRSFQKLQKEMEELNIAGLANFEKGALEHINPNLTIDDQADLLPYDKSYEFPVEQLKLGEQIGSGAFGVVVKGEAKGVFESETTTPVAVKMVNRTIGDIYIKALASELKIMIYLGKHVNIVNLLGAYTKNIAKRELYVIVEYCRFGNLKEYLLNHRHTFIDQIDPKTGQLDFSIGSDLLQANNENYVYMTPSFANCLHKRQVSKCDTTTSTESDNQDPAVETSESVENVHYKGDYHDTNRPVCTKDLLLWSFQVARGMEYLSMRKVLHGDLAARNILLTDGNVVKICDFGLSKKMYQKDIYKKSGDEMLPVKWMAIEAITDKIFSIQSDVWSFGVVLWEIFSLARTPYPGMEFNEGFCEKLLEGYRMKVPQYATQNIYEIMLLCWDADPTMRPSFTQLVGHIGFILDETIREHYIDMNTGYLKMNAEKFRNQNSDYLSMMGAPDFTKYSSPYRYVNITNSSAKEVDNTYL